MLRPVAWTAGDPFAKLQALPKNAKPITTWSDVDAAFVSVVQEIRQVVQQLLEVRKSRQNVIEAETKYLHDNSKTEVSFQRTIRTYENASLTAESVVSGLIESLSTENAQVRAEAALVLGKIGDENAVPALCHVLATDEDPEVRRSAAEALGMIGGAEAES
ncbi:MAG: HEAT repeat domain-containing protein [Leptolyngbyaceae cyanobacterium RM2_2_4]|nr:HEAT repeat domain-containing protein [Leptolyngbyaceae cyanobacterium SL_5_14]NJO52991.1 HEAT repeat domain-containing protein [Leptolyngbyaceae cyanobacterium RM2_2_4]